MAKQNYPIQVQIKANTSIEAMKATQSLNYLAQKFDAKGIINIVNKFKSSRSTQAAVSAAASGLV